MYVAPHHRWQQEKKSTQHKDPLKSKKFQIHFFEHMCIFKNKHNRFAEKIIGAVNNFVNKFWALQRKLAISSHFPKIPLKEAVVHTKPIEQSINQWNVKYSIFEPQPNEPFYRYLGEYQFEGMEIIEILHIRLENE